MLVQMEKRRKPNNLKGLRRLDGVPGGIQKVRGNSS